MKIGILVNREKDVNLDVSQKLVNWLSKKPDVVILLRQEIAQAINTPEYAVNIENMYTNSDFIIVLGGDGTLLQVAREIAMYNVPLLGVNLGRLGFLAEIEIDNIYTEIEKILAGKYIIEERNMLLGSIILNNVATKDFLAFNDIGITRSASRILRFNIYINEHFVDVYSADGVIIASPTGSTGYSLSAGGAILCPDVPAMIITPKCAHNLYSRSIVVNDNNIIKIKPQDDEADVSVDGQNTYILKKDEDLLVKKANYTIKLIKVSDKSFFDILRTKITER